MHRPRSVSIWLLPLLVLAVTGCSTVGKAVVWPVKKTVELATDVTAFTAKTTISLTAEIVEYTAEKTVDLAFDVGGRVLEDAVQPEVAPAVKIARRVLDE